MTVYDRARFSHKKNWGVYFGFFEFTKANEP